MDYISREEILAEYDRQHKGPSGGARKMIETWPAADVASVVRCKDCIAYESADGFCYVHADHMAVNDFCSMGTKRE